VRYFADPDPKLASIVLGSEVVSVVVPAAHRVRAKQVTDLRAFDGETWLGFPADRRHPEASLERRLIAAGIANPRITPVDSLTAQKRLVGARACDGLPRARIECAPARALPAAGWEVSCACS
jgi:DNA-binding transcriptional LysR family regulator